MSAPSSPRRTPPPAARGSISPWTGPLPFRAGRSATTPPRALSAAPGNPITRIDVPPRSPSAPICGRPAPPKGLWRSASTAVGIGSGIRRPRPCSPTSVTPRPIRAVVTMMTTTVTPGEVRCEAGEQEVTGNEDEATRFAAATAALKAEEAAHEASEAAAEAAEQKDVCLLQELKERLYQLKRSPSTQSAGPDSFPPSPPTPPPFVLRRTADSDSDGGHHNGGGGGSGGGVGGRRATAADAFSEWPAKLRELRLFALLLSVLSRHAAAAPHAVATVEAAVDAHSSGGAAFAAAAAGSSGGGPAYNGSGVEVAGCGGSGDSAAPLVAACIRHLHAVGAAAVIQDLEMLLGIHPLSPPPVDGLAVDGESGGERVGSQRHGPQVDAAVRAELARTYRSVARGVTLSARSCSVRPADAAFESDRGAGPSSSQVVIPVADQGVDGSANEGGDAGSSSSKLAPNMTDVVVDDGVEELGDAGTSLTCLPVDAMDVVADARGDEVDAEGTRLTKRAAEAAGAGEDAGAVGTGDAGSTDVPAEAV